MSYLMDREVAHNAVKLIEPSLTAMEHHGRSGGLHAHIVVLDPSRKPAWEDFEASILYERSFCKEEWTRPHREIARSEARLVYCYGCSTRHIQHVAPYAYGGSDSVRGGGICLEGIVVACSCDPVPTAEMIAYWIAAACRGIAIGNMERIVNLREITWLRELSSM